MTRDPQAVDALVNHYRSRATPTIVVDDEVMIGFDPERLDELLAS